MSYRAQVRISVINRDDTTGKQIGSRRPEMDFTVLIQNPGEGVNAAKAECKKLYAPDLLVRVANMASRDVISVYLCAAASHPCKHVPKQLKG